MLTKIRNAVFLAVLSLLLGCGSAETPTSAPVAVSDAPLQLHVMDIGGGQSACPPGWDLIDGFCVNVHGPICPAGTVPRAVWVEGNDDPVQLCCSPNEKDANLLTCAAPHRTPRPRGH